jgi:hypothetical protein
MSKKPTAKPVRKSRSAKADAAVNATRTPAARVAPASGGYKVRVLEGRIGYYDDSRRHEGDVFVIRDKKDFSDNWMEYVDAKTPERLTTAKGALAKEVSRLQGDARADAAAEKSGGAGDDVI